MNIFRLDSDYSLSATYHCDKHVVKMILEQTQLLHTSLHTRGFRAEWLYKPFNPKHPSSRWAMETRSNFTWVAKHGLSLCDEYTRRYKKKHKCFDLLLQALDHVNVIPEGPETKQLLAMPKQFQSDDVVHSYRLYYAGSKFRFATWRHSPSVPSWWEEYRNIVIQRKLEIVNDKDDGVLRSVA